jgi:hypothetical protein
MQRQQSRWRVAHMTTAFDQMLARRACSTHAEAAEHHKETTMSTTLIRQEDTLTTLFHAHLLCAVCQERAWTQTARWCPALICAACAEGEPEPEKETTL